MKIKKFNEHKGIKLSDIYDTYPDQDELIWNFVSQDDFESYFEVEVGDVSEIFNTIKDQLDHITEDQKEIISDYRHKIETIKDDILVLSYDNILIDGHHRLVAMYLEGVKKFKFIRV